MYISTHQQSPSSFIEDCANHGVLHHILKLLSVESVTLALRRVSVGVQKAVDDNIQLACRKTNNTGPSDAAIKFVDFWKTAGAVSKEIQEFYRPLVRQRYGSDVVEFRGRVFREHMRWMFLEIKIVKVISEIAARYGCVVQVMCGIKNNKPVGMDICKNGFWFRVIFQRSRCITSFVTFNRIMPDLRFTKLEVEEFCKQHKFPLSFISDNNVCSILGGLIYCPDQSLEQPPFRSCFIQPDEMAVEYLLKTGVTMGELPQMEIDMEYVMAELASLGFKRVYEPTPDWFMQKVYPRICSLVCLN